MSTDALGADGHGPISLQLDGYLKNGQGNRGPLDVEYDLIVTEPTAELGTIQVTQQHRATSAFSLSATRRAAPEAFRVVQFSSMFLDDLVHDSDSTRYCASDASVVGVKFAPPFGRLVFTKPLPLGAAFFDSVHWDNEGFNRNAVNLRLVLDPDLYVGHFTPQGWLTPSTNPNDDNVGLWIHWDSAPETFDLGATGIFTYTIEATDDPQAVPCPSGTP